MTKKVLFFISAFVLFFITNVELSAQDKSDAGFKLFDSDELLEISLKFDITQYLKEKPQDEYLDAEITFHLNNSDSLVNSIKLRARGVSRYKICNFPPIRLRFEDELSKPYDLMGIKNVKLITQCGVGKKFEEYLLKEYLSYKLYNVVTDTSFRVRLVRINYIDTGKKEINRTQFGVIIEPLKLLGNRLGAVEKENLVVRRRFVDPGLLDKTCMFQYMIGNEDWFLTNLHNLKVIEPVEGDKSILAAIPYDFDYSGLVNTYYAVPNEKYGLESIQERIYAGPCRTDEMFRKVINAFQNMKDEFYNEIEKLEYLNPKAKKQMVKYLDTYYVMFKRDFLIKKMKDTCAK